MRRGSGYVVRRCGALPDVVVGGKRLFILQGIIFLILGELLESLDDALNRKGSNNE